MRIMLSGVAIEGGGAEQVIQDLARGFAARGHEVMVAFLEGTDAVVPELGRLGIRCERLLPRRELADSPLADATPSCALRFRGLARSFAPHVFHAHVPRPTLWASLGLRMMRWRPPLVYTEHNVQDVYPRWSRFVYRAFLPVVDRVVCVSDAAARSFAARWTRAADPVRIWNGIEPGRVAPTRTPVAVRDELGATMAVPVLCNVANIGYRKGHDVLIEALARLAPSAPDLRCWIAGSFEHEPAMVQAVRAAIADSGLDETVCLLGRRRDVPDLLHAADIFVLSSRQEGFPITILEAMAAGKPIVATDVGGCAEAVVHGETGLIVPPEDPAALAEAIASLLADPDRARTMGEAGRERVQREFTVDRMVEQHLELYAQAIGAQGR